MDRAALEKALVLAVGRDKASAAGGQFHGALHHFGALDTLAVVGKADDMGGHALDVGQLLSLLADRDGAEGQDIYDGVLFDGIQLDLEMLDAVGHGV